MQMSENYDDLKKRLIAELAAEDLKAGVKRSKEEFIKELQKRLAVQGVGDA